MISENRDVHSGAIEGLHHLAPFEDAGGDRGREKIAREHELHGPSFRLKLFFHGGDPGEPPLVPPVYGEGGIDVVDLEQSQR